MVSFRLLTDRERLILQTALEDDSKLNGFPVLLHLIREGDFSMVTEDLELITRVKERFLKEEKKS